MPPRSKIQTVLPDELRKSLERKLVDNGFGNYKGLESWLAEQGYSISHAAIHRHGQELEQRLAMIKASTQAAEAIVEAAPDTADSRSAAVMSLVQTELFNVLLSLHQAESADDMQGRVKLLSDAAKSIAQLSRASVNQKQWAEEIRQRERLQAAKEVSAALKSNGISEELEQSIRQILLGKAA
jgi:hypothetical protein